MGNERFIESSSVFSCKEQLINVGGCERKGSLTGLHFHIFLSIHSSTLRKIIYVVKGGTTSGTMLVQSRY
jgi:hypothetical protein